MVSSGYKSFKLKINFMKNLSLPKNRVALLFLFFTMIFFVSCKKDIPTENFEVNKPTDINKADVNYNSSGRMNYGNKSNPFSYQNILKARITLQNSANPTQRNSYYNNGDSLFTYLRFDPDGVTGSILQQLEADTTIQILAFPFADGGIYNDSFALDEAKAEALADGKLYAVVKQNSATENLIITNLNPQILDTLFLPAEDDTTLQIQALREAGYTEEEVNAFRICLLKRPSGFVRYLDQATGGLVNVANMQVWGLVFGIPIYTHTNANGFYNFPWRFSLGTIMGTKAKNLRVNVKPLNTQGAWWLTIPTQFIVGSTHIRGWVSSCQMRNEVNFHFTEHKQNRYWAQLLHGVNLHDQYSLNDGIQRAPFGLTLYAHWDDNYGNASAPMLRHINGTAAVIEGVINNIFGGNVNLPTNYPNIFGLLSGVLPDVTIKTGHIERPLYSNRLMHTLFHELGHGSHFQNAGHLYWINYIIATLSPGTTCPGYGCGGGSNDGKIAVGESWAEFIGTTHALRHHPNGQKINFAGTTFIPYNQALETEEAFVNVWIPTGIFHDLIDIANTDPSENWDQTGGLTISQLYQGLGPNTNHICDFHLRMFTLFPWLGQNQLENIFAFHGNPNCF